MVADDAAAIKTALEVALGADEHPFAELTCIEVLEARAGVDPQAMASALRGGRPDGAAHQRLERAVTGHIAAVEVDQTFVRELVAQPFSETADKRWQERPGLQAVNGFDHASPAPCFR